MPKNKVEISKVLLKVGGKEIELSLEEAKELREILNDTFGAKIELAPAPVIIERPYRPYWWGPYWTTTITATETGHYTIACASNGTSADLLGITPTA